MASVKFVKMLPFLILPFLSFSCILFDNGTDNVVDDYDVTWIDLHEQRALYKGERLVPAYVFAVGHNSRFVFAKQYPLSTSSSEKIDTSVINYYIVERTKQGFQDKPTYGPMTKESFIKKCIELGIKEPEFDLTYPTNL